MTTDARNDSLMTAGKQLRERAQHEQVHENVDEVLDRGAQLGDELCLVDDSRPLQRPQPLSWVRRGAGPRGWVGEGGVGGVGPPCLQVARQGRLSDGSAPLQDGDLVRGAVREGLLDPPAPVDGVIHIKVTNNGSQFEEHLLEKLENGSVKSHGIGIGLFSG